MGGHAWVLLDPEEAVLMGPLGRASTGRWPRHPGLLGRAGGEHRRRGTGLFRAHGQRGICGLDADIDSNLSRIEGS